MLVASVVLAVEVIRRPRHRATVTAAADIAEPAPARPASPPAPFRPPPPPPARRVRLPVPSPARIAGRLHVPAGADIVHVIVTPNGGTGPEASGFDDQGTFRIDGLVSGRRYDVEFSGPNVRTLRMIGVVAPAADLDVALEARAVVHVAIGFPRGERCPVDTLQVRAREGELTAEDGIIVFTPDCRFEFAPPRGGQLTVSAEGGGLTLEAAITIPEHGDPEPICLNPPCRANPMEGQARLRVMLERRRLALADRRDHRADRRRGHELRLWLFAVYLRHRSGADRPDLRRHGVGAQSPWRRP